MMSTFCKHRWVSYSRSNLTIAVDGSDETLFGIYIEHPESKS